MNDADFPTKTTATMTTKSNPPPSLSVCLSVCLSSLLFSGGGNFGRMGVDVLVSRFVGPVMRNSRMTNFFITAATCSPLFLAALLFTGRVPSSSIHSINAPRRSNEFNNAAIGAPVTAQSSVKPKQMNRRMIFLNNQ